MVNMRKGVLSMQIIISPTKTMAVSNPMAIVPTEPKFSTEKEQIFTKLRSMSVEQLQTLWQCSLAIAEQNYHRLHATNVLTGPAIFTYQGLQFQALAPTSLTVTNLNFLQQHLWILSGAYGILRPFDAVEPYRLEMKNKLTLAHTNSLYTFWDRKLVNTIDLAMTQSSARIILNLASKEYAKSIEKLLPATTIMLTVAFVVKRNGKYLQQATMAKKARGRMLGFIARNEIDDIERLKEFDELGFLYNESISSATKIVFVYQGEQYDKQLSM